MYEHLYLCVDNTVLSLLSECVFIAQVLPSVRLMEHDDAAGIGMATFLGRLGGRPKTLASKIHTVCAHKYVYMCM